MIAILSRQNFETKLDAGLVKVRMRNGNLWAVRRNGATKLWVCDPTRWRVPCKAGYKTTFRVDQDTTVTVADDGTLVI